LQQILIQRQEEREGHEGVGRDGKRKGAMGRGRRVRAVAYLGGGALGDAPPFGLNTKIF